MASVTNNLTRIHDAEGTLTTANLPSGGAGATANTDIFLQATQSLGKRITDTGGPSGFVLVDAADNDCSAADVHVGVWFWVTHYAILDAVRIAFGTGTGTPTNYDAHTFDYANEYPQLGGWVRAWIDVSRTPENSGGTGLNEAQLRSYGIQVSFSTTPGGNASNVILDAADFTNGGAALTLTGTSGAWTDFTSADENTTNQYGVFREVGGVYNCFARVQLGTSGSSLVFDQSNFSVVFPNQSLVGDTFMGINIDLQNASTNIDMASGSFTSSGTKKGDFVVVGTSGTLDMTNCSFNSLRLITLTSASTLNGCAFNACGQITAASATMLDSKVTGYTGSSDTSALVWNTNVDPDGKLDGSTFTKGAGTTHAIEFGTTSPTTMTLDGVTFSGYNASNAQTDSAIHIKRTTGTVTINIVGGGSTPSYKTDGATVVINSGTVTATVKVVNAAGTAVQSANVFLAASNGTGPFPYQETVTIANSGTTATVTHTTHGMATNDKVLIAGASHDANNGVFSITVTGTDTYTYTMGSSPGSNPTGTITSTYVAIKGLTDSNGEIAVTRVFPTDQPVSGWARKSSAAPYYKTGLITGTIDSGTGASLSAVLIADE